MIGQNKERWRELCEQVEVEQDGKKLVELTTEIYRLLEEKRRRIQRKRLMDATPPLVERTDVSAQGLEQPFRIGAGTRSIRLQLE